MKYISLGLFVSGLYLLVSVGIWFFQLYREIGYLAVLALGDPLYSLIPVALGIILIFIANELRIRSKSKSSSF